MYFFLIAAVCIVILTVTAGFVIKCKKSMGRVTTKKALGFNLLSFIPVMAGALIFLLPDMARAAAETAAGTGGNGLGFIAAALSTGLATIGAGYAVGAVASSALGAVSEDPSLLGRTLIFVGLAEGIAIYGLIISIMILGAM
ncbi:MAG TPA: ATPase [Clostridiales bacterium]|nr:ATPase [Clostridiales bacterium]